MAVTQSVEEISNTDYRNGVFLVLIAGTFWSFAGLVVRLMENVIEWQILLYRSIALIATLLTYIAIKNRGDVIGAFRKAGADACLAGMFLGCGFGAWIFAMTHTTIANALFILSAAPFIAAVIGHFFLQERARLLTWGFMTIAAAGVAVMVIEGANIGTLDGNLFALGAAIGFAIFSVILRKGRKNDMTPAVCWAGCWGIAIGVSMIMLNPQFEFAISSYDLLLCSILGIFQVGLGLIIFTAGSKYLPVAELNLLSLTEVVLGPLWVALFIREMPTQYTLIGGGIVLSAIVAQALYGIRRRAPIGVV